MITPYLRLSKILKITAIAFTCGITITPLGCKRENKKPPLDEKTFVSILSELHLLEAQLEELKYTHDTLFYAAGKHYDSLFCKHGVDQKQFQETFDYYVQRPKLLDKIYEKIVDTLSEHQAILKE